MRGPAPGRRPDAVSAASTEADEDLRREGAALADVLEAALPGWVRRSVRGITTAWGGPLPADLDARVDRAGRDAVAAVVPALRRLVGADVDAQRANPLHLVRGAVAHPTAVLRDLGVPGVVRDDFDVAHFPADEYGLVPLSFADLGPDVHEQGLRWGAAKARAHLVRHRRPPSEPPAPAPPRRPGG